MTTKQIPIWIDCDTGTDDTVAIMLAHALPELQIIGLSAVAGNSLLCNTFPNTRRVVHLLGADYPVYPGAERPLVREPHVAGAFHGENGLGNVQLPLPDTAPEQTPAWDALYAAAKRMPGVTVTKRSEQASWILPASSGEQTTPSSPASFAFLA